MTGSYHNPLHLRLEGGEYWLTASTLNHRPVFDGEGKLTLLRNALEEIVREKNIRMRAWVIVPDHYHLLARLPQAEDLEMFTRLLHGRSSYQINGLENKRGRKVWYQYWDRYVRNERDFYTRFNYIHHNPLKHGYAGDPGDYEFSSYRHYLRKYGSEWMGSVWETYPIVDFTPEEGDGGNGVESLDSSADNARL